MLQREDILSVLHSGMKMFNCSLVTPAQAGVQKTYEKGWIPAFAGMTMVVPRFDWEFKSQCGMYWASARAVVVRKERSYVL